MTSDNKDSLIDYKQAGVDVDAGYDLVKKIESKKKEFNNLSEKFYAMQLDYEILFQKRYQIHRSEIFKTNKLTTNVWY